MTTTQEKERICLECLDIIHGRVDKKFCCDQCRNCYNNRNNSNVNSQVRRVNHILRKNRRIMAELNPDGKRTLNVLALAEEGFNFHYFTNIYRTKKGAEYFFCYDQGYIKLDEHYCMLVVKQDYVR